MRIIRHGIRNLFIVGLMAWTIPTMAQWELDTDRSALNFVSIKNNSIAETHVFNSMVGFVGEDGRVQLAIDLDSVETLIPIRNERMREFWFDLANNPTATVTATIDPAAFKTLGLGDSTALELDGSLSLKGVEAPFAAQVTVTRVDADKVLVVSDAPVIVDAGQFEDISDTILERKPAQPKLLSTILGTGTTKDYLITNSFVFDMTEESVTLPSGISANGFGSDVSKEVPKQYTYQVPYFGMRFNVAPGDYMNRRIPGTRDMMTEVYCIAAMNKKSMVSWELFLKQIFCPKLSN